MSAMRARAAPAKCQGADSSPAAKKVKSNNKGILPNLGKSVPGTPSALAAWRLNFFARKRGVRRIHQALKRSQYRAEVLTSASSG
jgi:hypothetical protein